MKRRTFITALGGAAAWPVVARAQQPAAPVVGVLNPGSVRVRNNLFAGPFRRGLAETGYIEGQNVTIEDRWAEGQFDQMPALVADLVRREVAAIVANGTQSALAAKSATSTIPIVFLIGDDPVKFGLVAALNRPGGSATGINAVAIELESKRLELLHRIVPGTEIIGALVNLQNPNAEAQVKDLQNAARAVGRQIHIFHASTEREIDVAFTTLAQERAGALTVAGDTFFTIRRYQIVTLAAHYSIPAIYQRRDFPEVGGLVSYGTDFDAVFRQVGIYVGRILKGEKPADLPVVQPTKFEFVINLNTAKALGLTIPPNVLAIADELIE
jgi:putative ABC transport system substrate-binding protein